MGLESGREIPQENPILKLDRMDCRELIEYQREWLKKYIQSPRYREQLINEEQYTQKMIKYQKEADKITSSKEVQHIIDQTFGRGWEVEADVATSYLGLGKGDFIYEIKSLGWDCIDASKKIISLVEKLLKKGISNDKIEKRLWASVLSTQKKSDIFFQERGMIGFKEIYYLIAKQLTTLLRGNDDKIDLYCTNMLSFFTKIQDIEYKTLSKSSILKNRVSEFRTRDIEFDDEDFMVDTKIDNNIIKDRIDERLNALNNGYEIKFDIPAEYIIGEYIRIGYDEDIVEYRNRDDEGSLNEEQGEMDNAFTPESGKTYFFKNLSNSILTPIHEFAHASVDSTCLMSSYEIKQLMKYKVAQSNGVSDKSNNITDYYCKIAEIYAHLTTLKFILHEAGITNVFEKEITREDFHKLIAIYQDLPGGSNIGKEIISEARYFIDVFDIGFEDDNGVNFYKEDEKYQNLIDCLNLIASNSPINGKEEKNG